MNSPACCCRYLVQEARRLGLEVIDRCNLTVLLEPGQEDLVSFLAQHQVRVFAMSPSCPLLPRACSREVGTSCKHGLPPALLSPWLQDSGQARLQPACQWCCRTSSWCKLGPKLLVKCAARDKHVSLHLGVHARSTGPVCCAHTALASAPLLVKIPCQQGASVGLYVGQDQDLAALPP